VSFRWIAPLSLQKLLDIKTVEVVPVEGTKANEVAVILSLAIDKGERSVSRPDAVPQQTKTTVDIEEAGRA
jgi:hypothetical protein